MSGGSAASTSHLHAGVGFCFKRRMKMLRKWVRLSLAAISIVVGGRMAFAAAPTIYPLGIAAGENGSRGYGVNDSGQVAVTSIEAIGTGIAGRYDGAAP